MVSRSHVRTELCSTYTVTHRSASLENTFTQKKRLPNLQKEKATLLNPQNNSTSHKASRDKLTRFEERVLKIWDWF